MPEESDFEKKSEEVLEELQKLNQETAKGHSLRRTFLVGIVYGVGFVVGSVVVATILIGILGPVFLQIPIARDFFENGSQFIHATK